MDTLYIIGNGFDISHGLPTSYWDFRTFLEKHDLDFLLRLEEMFGIASIDLDDPRVNAEAWETKIKEILWGSLEEKLAYPDTEEMRSVSESVVGQLDLDGGNWGIEDTMDDYWESMYGFVKKLPSLVLAWVNSIDLSSVVPRKKSFFNLTQGKFLTFNYTSTLEECYRIDPQIIEHVHGGLEPYTDSMPVFGHGDRNAAFDHRMLAGEADALYDEGNKSIENAIANYYERTLKDTSAIIRQKRWFFQSLQTTKNIVVLGLSYSDVDMPYLHEVNKWVGPDTRWTMCYYSPKDNSRIDWVINQLHLNDTMVTKIQSNKYLDS